MRPKFNVKALKLILCGGLDYPAAIKYLSNFPQRVRAQQSFIDHRPMGLLTLVSGVRDTPLVASAAAQFLNQIINYQRNTHAESVVKELAKIDPSLMSLFGFEELMKVDQCKKVALTILKAYIDKRERDLERTYELVDTILYNESLRQELIDFISYRRNMVDNLKQSRIDDNRSSFCLVSQSQLSIVGDQSESAPSSVARSASQLSGNKSSTSLNSFRNQINKKTKKLPSNTSDVSDNSQKSDNANFQLDVSGRFPGTVQRVEPITNQLAKSAEYSLSELDTLINKFFGIRTTFTDIPSTHDLLSVVQSTQKTVSLNLAFAKSIHLKSPIIKLSDFAFRKQLCDQGICTVLKQ